MHLVGHANTRPMERCRVEELGLSRRGRTAIGWLDRGRYVLGRNGRLSRRARSVAGSYGPRWRSRIRTCRPRGGLAGIGAFISSLSGGIWSARGVGDLTDELLENVFEGNQATCLIVLVDQASEV